jgi:hypothetical protein
MRRQTMIALVESLLVGAALCRERIDRLITLLNS